MAMNCNIVHDNNIKHIIMYILLYYTILYYTILPYIIEICKHNTILFYKWDHMYPGWSS